MITYQMASAVAIGREVQLSATTTIGVLRVVEGVLRTEFSGVRRN
jgi:hypothetical protein